MCLPNNAPTSLVMTADSTTLKLDNQKNGWKGVCVHQDAIRESFNCPVRALARRALHLWDHNAAGKTLLSSFFYQGTRYDVCGKDISKGLKLQPQSSNIRQHGESQLNASIRTPFGAGA